MHSRAALLSAASLVSLVGANSALAQSAPSHDPDAAHLEDIVVTADPLGRSPSDVIANVALIHGDDLVHRRQGTLGETLNGVPGVNSDPFGGGASRPVIRGQTAPRVRVLTDGAAIIDASEVSPDHAITGDPLLLEGIEILRGPSALIYGGGAIGGAVNLLDKKVPSRAPEDGFDGVIEGRLGTADEERSLVVGATIAAGPLAFRFEGVDRRTSDYDVPRFLPHDHEHEDEGEEDEDHEEHEEAEAFDVLAGSFSESRTLTGGVSWIGSRGYLGAAYTEQTSDYGLPGHAHQYEDCHPHGSSLHCGSHDEDEDDHDHDHGDEEGDIPVVDLVSRRVDVRGELNDPFSGVERLRFRGGYTDYQHDEIEDGEVGTTFTNEGYDLRIEAQHAPIAGFRGVIGGQASRSDFEASGDESFIPPTRTESAALFMVESIDLGDWSLEGALRQEWQTASAFDGAVPAIYPDQEHSPFSISAGASWRFAPDFQLSLTASRSQRAPTVQELYARGVHLATNTYEIGTLGLDEETVLSLELGLEKTAGDTTFNVSAYRYDYDGYIYADTLDQFEDFRLIRYTQADAVFTGLEGEVTRRFAPGLSGTIFGDLVRAELDGGEDLPRIPAARLGGRLDAFRGPWSGAVEYIRVFEQDRIADFEEATPGYDMVNATVAYDFQIAGAGAQVYVRGSNLLDEVALNHASYLSALAPLRGRNFTLGVRTRF
ncbi:MAG: TonB-dependent receptor [Brevundimonas sp.]|uniref:TonB-dependent receptor domain-containing protein n=1 Tax=Brevundimonas sp. TaxID=1871086 RepID=UPI0017FED09A|nr:TonB-dependent receptor [Brevundimonas sp.]MBA4805152.1 TonB-dependent receptor [Brevundimonas sp.]